MVSNRLSVLLTLLFSCLGLVAADADTSNKKNSYQHYAVTGVQAGVNAVTGARPARQNILVMQNDPYMLALYIQALVAMQTASLSDPTSWFQIAGIHGRPYAPWDKVPQGKGAPLTGYCTHGSVLFPTWHRPYLAALEQILSNHCQNIASKYPEPERQQYQAAAANFRIPYWDWASNPVMPDIVNTPTITIPTPYGIQTVPNPLYSYKFQQYPLSPPSQFPASLSSGVYDWYLAKDAQTYRCPINQTGGPSNATQANLALASNYLQYQAYYALTKSTSYNNFATSSLWGPSIESVHGLVHVLVGGSYGHMTQLSYAGFDPIFFLHHCNVDRMIALYQAMNPASQNPNNFLTPNPESSGTFSLPPSEPFGPGPNDTLITPLEPFSTNTQGTPWTSQGAENLSSFGYTYPEISDWNQSPSELSQNVTAQVNMLYSGQSTPSPSKRSVTADGPEQVIEWSVALRVSKFELNGMIFVVRLFVGGVPADPETWVMSESCVGNFVVMPPPQAPTGQLPDVKVFDEISLVLALRNVGQDGQDVETVVEYLTGNFEWRVQLMDGTVVDADQYQSLEIEVQEEVVMLAKDVYELPSYGAKTLHPEITHGKAGGYSGKKMGNRTLV